MTEFIEVIYGPLLAVALTSILIAATRRPAAQFGWVDKPDARKAHSGDVPLIGGVAILLGFVAVQLLVGSVAEWPVYFVCGALLAIIGAIDDVRPLSYQVRLLVQAGCALTVGIAGDVYLRDLGGLLPGAELLQLGVFALPITVIGVVGLINAVNMMDGMDGLAGGVFLVACAGLATVAAMAGKILELQTLLVLGACVLGFLLFNFRLPGRTRAEVFLGDAGTMFLGFSLAWFAIRLSQGPDRAMMPVTALWLAGLPIVDTACMMIRRIRKGISPFKPDREHLHHIFMMAGFSVNETVLALIGVAALSSACGILGLYLGVPDGWMLLGFVCAAVGYNFAILRAWRVMRFLRRSICRRRNISDRRRLRDRRQDYRTAAAWSGRERRSGSDRRRGDRRDISADEEQ